MKLRKTTLLQAAGLVALVAGLVLGRGAGFQGDVGFGVNIPRGRCDPPSVTVFAGFRTHYLIPHVTLGTIIDGQPQGQGASRVGNTVYFHGEPFLRIVRHTHPGRVRVVVTALRDLWVQEPGLAVKIAGAGTWQGFGPRWSTDEYDLHMDDAYRSTVHFSRAASGRRYIQTIKYREGSKCLTMYSDGRFEKLLRRPERLKDEWTGALVMGSPQGVRLSGTYLNPNESLRRWELAGGKWFGGVSQMYFLGWTGGPAAIVGPNGVGPPPGTRAGPEYSLVYNPPSWRELEEGEQMAETVYATAS